MSPYDNITELIALFVVPLFWFTVHQWIWNGMQIQEAAQDAPMQSPGHCGDKGSETIGGGCRLQGFEDEVFDTTTALSGFVF